MKFVQSRARLIAPLLLMMLLVACGANPKSKAADWANRFPAEIGDFETDRDDRLELTLENPSPIGHVILPYENGDEVKAYLTIEVYATETAADVEFSSQMRTWELQGVRFERERIDGEPMDIAQTQGGYLAFFQWDETILTLAVIPPVLETGELLPQEDIDLFLETMVAIAKNRD